MALQDYEAIEQTISSSVRLTMGVLLGAMVLALLLGVLLISSVVRHLKILVDKFDAFALTGKPVPEDNGPYLTRRDEIGQLHRHFDKMTRDYDRMTRDNYEQQLPFAGKADAAAPGPGAPAFPVQYPGVHLLPGEKRPGPSASPL